MNTVPIVDISRPDQTSLDALDAACRDHGFFLLSGHNLDTLIECLPRFASVVSFLLRRLSLCALWSTMGVG